MNLNLLKNNFLPIIYGIVLFIFIKLNLFGNSDLLDMKQIISVVALYVVSIISIEGLFSTLDKKFSGQVDDYSKCGIREIDYKNHKIIYDRPMVLDFLKADTSLHKIDCSSTVNLSSYYHSK